MGSCFIPDITAEEKSIFLSPKAHLSRKAGRKPAGVVAAPLALVVGGQAA